MKRLLLALAVIALCVLPTNAQTIYSLAPSPYQTVLLDTGAIASSAKITTYLANSSTLADTYSDSIGTLNENPIVADAFGRFVCYLKPGTAYKFVYTTSGNVSIRTQDYIYGVPVSTSVDVPGTAGENLTVGQVAYLSDGSGSKTAGRWYKADSGNNYSSLLPEIGMVTATVTSGNAASIRIAGRMTGLSGLVAGTRYYVGSAGALTASMLTRLVGIADSTTSLILGGPNTSISPNYVAKTGTYTAVSNDVVSATSGSFTVTLPAAASNPNQIIWVVNNGTGTITVGRTGSDTIGLATSQTLNPATASAQGDSMTFVSDGVSNWNIM